MGSSPGFYDGENGPRAVVYGEQMKELIRSNDPVFLSWLEAHLAAEGIEVLVLDNHMSIIDGSISAIPRRVMVDEDEYDRAKTLMEDGAPV